LDDKRPISWTAGFKLGEMLQKLKKGVGHVMSIVMDTGSEWVKEWVGGHNGQ